MIYRAAPPECVRTVTLDALSAVYHRPSGQTHIVTQDVVAILSALGRDALDCAAIAERIGDDAGEEGVAPHLADLLATGLVTAQ